MSHFQSELFDFLRDLEANNNREWFDANKGRYEEHVKEAAFGFISDFGPRLRQISPHFQAIPKATGGSLFRIYRDTRFAKDKTPYKTHVGVHFRHEAAKDAHAPGFYLHLATDGCFAGVGTWHPASKPLQQIRSYLAEHPDEWLAARDAESFRGVFELQGESLKTAPRGFDKEHELMDDLRRKDFMGIAEIGRDIVTSPRLLDRFAELCAAGAPLQKFLCRALGVPF